MSKLLELPSISSLSHSNIIVCEPSAVIESIRDYFNRNLGGHFAVSGNPDFSLVSYDTFGIDEARDLKERQSRKAIGEQGKFFVLEINMITLEAQNSLLKTLEEPTPDTYIFLLAKDQNIFLPTVLSRCQIIRFETDLFSDKLKQKAKRFLAADIAERWQQIKEIIKDHEDGDKKIEGDWLNCLIMVYREKFDLAAASPEVLHGLAELEKAASYLFARGSSFKLLAENLALQLPIF